MSIRQSAWMTLGRLPQHDPCQMLKIFREKRYSRDLRPALSLRSCSFVVTCCSTDAQQAALLWRCMDIFRCGIDSSAFKELLANVITSRSYEQRSLLASQALSVRIVKSTQEDGMVDIHRFVQQHVSFSTNTLVHEIWDELILQKLSSAMQQSKEAQTASSCPSCGKSHMSLLHDIPYAQKS